MNSSFFDPVDSGEDPDNAASTFCPLSLASNRGMSPCLVAVTELKTGKKHVTVFQGKTNNDDICDEEIQKVNIHHNKGE